MKFIRIAVDMLHGPAAIKSYKLSLDILRTLITVLVIALRQLTRLLMIALTEMSRLALKALQKLILNRLQKLAEKVHYA